MMWALFAPAAFSLSLGCCDLPPNDCKALSTENRVYAHELVADSDALEQGICVPEFVSLGIPADCKPACKAVGTQKSTYSAVNTGGVEGIIRNPVDSLFNGAGLGYCALTRPYSLPASQSCSSATVTGKVLDTDLVETELYGEEVLGCGCNGELAVLRTGRELIGCEYTEAYAQAVPTYRITHDAMYHTFNTAPVGTLTYLSSQPLPQQMVSQGCAIPAFMPTLNHSISYETTPLSNVASMRELKAVAAHYQVRSYQANTATSLTTNQWSKLTIYKNNKKISGVRAVNTDHPNLRISWTDDAVMLYSSQTMQANLTIQHDNGSESVKVVVHER